MTETARRFPLARLRQMATGGAASIGVGMIATNLLRIVSSMTLTRLLDAHAYGVIGVITSVAYMLAMLSDVGFTAFVVRHEEADDPAFLDQVWTLHAIRGAGLTLLMVLIAEPAALFLGKPELAPVLAVWGLSFLLEGVSALSFATGVRAQQFWRLSLLDLGLNGVTFIVSLAAAVVLRSYWAMVIGMLAGAAVKTILSYALFPASRRRPQFSGARGRELWRFSRYIALSSMLTLLIMQTDKVVLARLMPLSMFGLYAIAVTLSAAPDALSSPYVTRVLYPIYARAAQADGGALRATFYAARRRVVLLFMFAVGGLIGAAPLVVALLYDPRYHDVAPYLQLIAISAGLRMPSLAANMALFALGRTRSTLIANIFRFAWLAIGVPIGLATGDILLLVAIVGTAEVPGLLCFWWNLRRAGLLDLREEGYGLAAMALGGAIGAAGAHVMLGLFPNL